MRCAPSPAGRWPFEPYACLPSSPLAYYSSWCMRICARLRPHHSECHETLPRCANDGRVAVRSARVWCVELCRQAEGCAICAISCTVSLMGFAVGPMLINPACSSGLTGCVDRRDATGDSLVSSVPTAAAQDPTRAASGTPRMAQKWCFCVINTLYISQEHP